MKVKPLKPLMYLLLLNDMQPSSIDDGAPLSSLGENGGDISHLIDDAMEDIVAPKQATPKTTRRAVAHDKSRKPPHTCSRAKAPPSKSKMEIHMSGDKSVVMEFNSDTDDDDDEDDDILRDLMRHHRPRQDGTGVSRGGSRGGGERKRRDVPSPKGKSVKQGGADQGGIFSESDEDYCFVEAPTVTKVVRNVAMCIRLAYML